MRRAFSTFWLMLALAGGLPAAQAARADALEELQARVIDVSRHVTPAVVHIEAAVKVNNRRSHVTGSGVIMDESGIVLTNEHVVERAEKVSVIVPNQPGRYPAEVVGTDKQTDLAVLRIQPRKDLELPVARLGDSEKLRVGEWVIAIGNPYGLDGTVSLGIVSAMGRDLKAADLLNDFIQTDAMIDRGSSGGPLVNLKAEVVGINSRGQGRGIGFTIPINTAKRVAADLVEAGKIARGYLGIAIQPLNRELASYWEISEVNGVIINGVAQESPAAQAGLQIGDILTDFDGQKVRAEKDEDIGQFQRLVAQSPVGKEVRIGVLREGKRQVLEARLSVQPKVVPDEEETRFGFTVQEVTEALFRQYRLDDRRGVLVSFVERGSEADEAGMAQGDLIQRIENTDIDDIEQFREALEALAGDRPYLIQARRGNDTRFLLIVPRSQERRAAIDAGQDPPAAPTSTR